jgi:cellobiose phosphorylase
MEALKKNVETTYTTIISQRQVELETLLTRAEEVETTKTETEVTNE